MLYSRMRTTVKKKMRPRRGFLMDLYYQDPMWQKAVHIPSDAVSELFATAWQVHLCKLQKTRCSSFLQKSMSLRLTTILLPR
jgi:hypothetical protein